MVTKDTGDSNIQVLSRKDFVSDQEVRWCPGCGDYSILAQTQRVMPTSAFRVRTSYSSPASAARSRLPYYMNTYGFHSIHGRAPTIRHGPQGLAPRSERVGDYRRRRCAQHRRQPLMHAIRRNVDISIVSSTTEIYGLTKGQYSPTSPLAKVTYSSPMGSLDWPLHPLALALGAEGTFVARSLDADPHHMVEILGRAGGHRGTSFVEIYQNCNIYNDGAFDDFTAKDVRGDRMLFLKHGEPMIFGKDNDKGIRISGLKPEVVELGKDGITEADILVHDETTEDPTIAFMLTRMDYPEFPVPVGVIRAVQRPTYNDLLEEQIATAIETQGEADLNALFRQGDTWEVE